MGAPIRRQRLDEQRRKMAREFINKQLTVPTEARTTPTGPLSAPIKARPVGLDAEVAAFLAKRGVAG